MDKTFVDGGASNNNQASNNEAKLNIKQKRKGRIILRNLTKEQRKTLLDGGKSALLGMLGGASAMGLFSFVEDANNIVPPEPELIEDIVVDDIETTDNTDISVESDPVVIYTEAPFAEGINDEMSFDEAFSTARIETGPGGIFEWRGNTYGTYYKEEWDSLTESDKDQYWASVSESTDSIGEEEIPEDIYTDNDINSEENIDANEIEPNNTYEYDIGEDDYIETFDIDGDGNIDAAMVDANGNEMPDIVIDMDGDGEMDQLILDLDPETGDITESSQVIYLDDQDYNNNNDIASNNEDIDLFEDEDLNPDIDIDNDMDMDDYIG